MPAHFNNATPTRVGTEDYLAVARGVTGCVVYGPYCPLLAGAYEVTFKIYASPERGSACTIDVFSFGQRKVIQTRLLKAQDLRASDGLATLAFHVEEPDRFEFRLFSTGRNALSIRRNRELRSMSPLPAGAVALLGDVDGVDIPAFYKAHLATFTDWSTKGFTFMLAQNSEILATYKGNVSFAVRNYEDLMIAGEVFFLNIYNAIPGRKAIAIDVGMNIGLTSLYLAAKSDVERVFAFEPFAEPFKRAEKNFGFNPDLDRKIERLQIGLSDVTATHEVLSSTEDTISVSIRGASSGNVETISVVQAAEALGSIIADAKAAGHVIILKLDCEGSEFGIVEALDRSGLLGDVSMVLCEWHKWWSNEKSQLNLFEPLLRSGFMVIDNTNPSDPHAGQFYAMKTFSN